jgi:DnaK suppressor protein
MKSHLTAEQRALLDRALWVRENAIERQLELHQQGLSRVEFAREVLAQESDDAPQRANDREVDIALSQIDLQELAAVRSARQRIHDEDYGVCIACGQAIPFERLSVEPQALRCVACQSIQERTL